MKDFRAFTSVGNGLLRTLKSKIKIIADKKINPKGSDKIYNNCVWDTGATNTVISNRVAEELNLTPVGKINVSTANGKAIVNKYIISLILPNNLMIENVEVASGNLEENTDMLLGMNIITLGDFSITNVDGKTMFSYRFPSCEKIDYCEEANKINQERIKQQQKALEKAIKQHGNEKCPCGSRRKYRYCCGKKEAQKIGLKV